MIVLPLPRWGRGLGRGGKPEHRRPAGLRIASTLGGNPISTTAAGAALAVFRQPGVYDHLHEIGAYLRQGMRQVLQARGIAGQIIGDGPLAQVVFTREEAPVHA